MRRRSTDKNWRPKTWVWNTWNKNQDNIELAAAPASAVTVAVAYGSDMIQQLSKAYFIFDLDWILEAGKFSDLFLRWLDSWFVIDPEMVCLYKLWFVIRNIRVSISSVCVWSSRIRVRSISGLVVKFLLAMQEPRVRFPADACFLEYCNQMVGSGWYFL